MNGPRWVSLVMVIGALGAAFGCEDRNTITGPAISTSAPIAFSTPRSGSANPARIVVPPSTSGVRPIKVNPRPTISLGTPPPRGLNGTWTGAIMFYVNPEEGDPPCENVASITVNLLESDGNLTGQFEAGCHGTLVLHGLLIGAQIFGSLDEAGGTSYGRINGTVSSNRIQFRTTRDLAGDGDEPDSDRDDNFMSSKVDLSR